MLAGLGFRPPLTEMQGKTPLLLLALIALLEVEVEAARLQQVALVELVLVVTIASREATVLVATTLLAEVQQAQTGMGPHQMALLRALQADMRVQGGALVEAGQAQAVLAGLPDVELVSLLHFQAEA